MFDNYGNNQAPPQPQPPPTKVVRFDKGYVQTTPGILQLIQINKDTPQIPSSLSRKRKLERLCNVVGFICIKVTNTWISSIFYNLLYWIGNIVTLLLFLMYLFHFVEKFDKMPWLKFQFFYCAVMVLAYIVCSIIATTIAESVGYAVGFFGLCAVIAYGMDGFLKFKAYRRGLPPQ